MLGCNKNSKNVLKIYGLVKDCNCKVGPIICFKKGYKSTCRGEITPGDSLILQPFVVTKQQFGRYNLPLWWKHFALQHHLANLVLVQRCTAQRLVHCFVDLCCLSMANMAKSSCINFHFPEICRADILSGGFSRLSSYVSRWLPYHLFMELWGTYK